MSNYLCPECGADDWREDYVEPTYQSCTIGMNADGSPNLADVDYTGLTGSYDGGCGSAERYWCASCEDGEIEVPPDQATRDAAALDSLAAYLRRPTWGSGADFLEWCASLVAGTGRDLQNGTTDEGETVKDGEVVA